MKRLDLLRRDRTEIDENGELRRVSQWCGPRPGTNGATDEHLVGREYCVIVPDRGPFHPNGDYDAWRATMLEFAQN